MLTKIRVILEMIRFSHTLFALPFALLAAIMAWKVPSALGEFAPFSWLHLLGILVCMVGARSAGMAFNRLVDRRIDAENPRTTERHLPSGQISVSTVVGFIVVCVAVFYAGTLLFLPNPLPLILATPVLAILLLYSYTKRFTSLAHFWLGLSLSLAPLAVWLALRGAFVIADPLDLLPPVLLSLAVVFWVGGFDIIYACQDYDFDVSADLKSVPARLGIQGALRVAALSHFFMMIALVVLPLCSQWGGPPLQLGWIYYVGLVPIAGLLAYEHLVVSHEDLARVNIAFFNINVIVSVGLLALVSLDLFIPWGTR